MLFKMISCLIAASIFLASCGSTTIINSNPSGADLYIDNQSVGITPYSYSDSKITGSSINLTFKKEGYLDFTTTIYRTERPDIGAIIGGCFFIIPFLWTMQYNTSHYYQLSPKQVESNTKNILNKTNELVKLKSLFEENIITQEEFSTLKSLILDNEYDYSKSLADQILTLKSLLDSGLLTTEEFNNQKSKLLSK